MESVSAWTEKSSLEQMYGSGKTDWIQGSDDPWLGSANGCCFISIEQYSKKTKEKRRVPWKEFTINRQCWPIWAICMRF